MTALARQTHPITLTLTESQQKLLPVLEAVLDRSSYTLQHAENAGQCLKFVQHSQLVLVDLFLDDIDGLSLIEEIRLQQPQAPIIAFLCNENADVLDLSETEITLMATQSGASAVFIAPYNLAELLTTIERLSVQPVAAHTA